MGETDTKTHIDNDIVNLKGKNNDNDIVETPDALLQAKKLKQRVLEEISQDRLDRLDEYLFGNNRFISDCGAFINPAIKQIERFMFVWTTELSDEVRKIIVCNNLNRGCNVRVPYKMYTNSPLWKYQSSIIKLFCNYTCANCGGQFVPTHLIVHHLSYEHIGSEFKHMDDVIVLCNDCHLQTHGIRRNNGYCE